MEKIRQKAKAVKVTSLNEVNQVLREIAHLQGEIERIDSHADRKIAKLKEEAALAGEDMRKRIIGLEQGVALYAEYNKDELFVEKRSVELSYGRIGFHRSTKISIKNRPAEKSTLALIKKLFPKSEAIRIKEEVNKDELSEWPDEKLAQVNARKEHRDSFYYEISREQVNQELLAARG